MANIDYTEWFADLVQYMIANTGKLVPFTTLQERYASVGRTTLLDWMSKAEAAGWVCKEKIKGKNKAFYMINADFVIGMLNAAQKSITGALGYVEGEYKAVDNGDMANLRTSASL